MIYVYFFLEARKTPLASIYRARMTAAISVRRLLLESKQEMVMGWCQWRLPEGRLESSSGTKTGCGDGLCGGFIMCQVDEAGFLFLDFPSVDVSN